MHALRLDLESTPTATPVDSVCQVNPAAPAAGLVLLAHEPESPWAARAFDELVPPATLQEARAGRDALAALLSRERAASADFLLALADFNRRRGWERLGHASLFAFLTRALGLSKGAAYVRLSAARLLPTFPEVEAALRDGRLCLSAAGELARVLTRENLADVLPRYFGCSAREAREVTAALAPRAVVPVREVVTAPAATNGAVRAVAAAPRAALALAETQGRSVQLPGSPPLPLAPSGAVRALTPSTLAPAGGSDPAGGEHPAPPPVGSPSAPAAVRAHEPPPTLPARAAPPPPRDEAEPLSADLRRLHVTVSRRLLEKLDRARDGLSHALPHATTEQVLEAALDLLLERQARVHALVKRPRTATGRELRPGLGGSGEQAACSGLATSGPAPSGPASPTIVAPAPGASARAPSAPVPVASATASPGQVDLALASPLHSSPVMEIRGTTPGEAAPPAPGRPLPDTTPAARRRGGRPPILAAVERAVRLRDGDRCQHPLDGGGVCGATWQVELDHVVPVALGGESSVANLRCACRAHNRRAAQDALGARAGERRRAGRRSAG